MYTLSILDIIRELGANNVAMATGRMQGSRDSWSLQFTSGLSQRQGMFLNNSPMIGNGADILELYTSGDMTVEHVTLVVR